MMIRWDNVPYSLSALLNKEQNSLKKHMIALTIFPSCVNLRELFNIANFVTS